MAIGNLNRLPETARKTLDDCIKQTSKNTGTTVVLALSYSARWEITEAAKQIASEVANGTLTLDEITENKISACLTTNNIPDPDLLIRTGGEKRISNFLLWQISYAELYFTDIFWPEFREEELYDAIATAQEAVFKIGVGRVYTIIKVDDRRDLDNRTLNVKIDTVNEMLK